MKGKKIDTEFLTNFISQCIIENKDSTNDILQDAKNKINRIDNKIKNVEKLKILRSKLLDVVTTFEKKSSTKDEDKKNLNFLNIKNINISRFICNNLDKSPVTLDILKSKDFSFYDATFTIKQLIESDIVHKSNNLLLRGNSFNDYMSFLKRRL